MAKVVGVDKNLLAMGVSMFAATFAAAFFADQLNKQENKILKDYAREITGGVLTVAGSVMMGDRKTRQLGLAVGATGVSTVVAGVARRVSGGGQTAADGNAAAGGGYVNGYRAPGGSTGGGSVGGGGGGSYLTPVMNGQVATATNGRQLFTLA